MLSQKSPNLVPVIIKIQYQFTKNIGSIVNGSTTNHRVVTLNSNNDWKEIYFSPASAKYKEPKKQTKAGNLFNQLLSFKYPGEYADSITELEELDELPVVVRIEFNTGTIKLMGSIKIPAYFKSSGQSDAKSTGDLFQFYCNTNHRAYLVENTENSGQQEPNPIQ